jgi:hypothetical protein
MDATGDRSGIQETEASFARAEQTADTLPGNQFVFRKRFKFYPE